MKMAKKNYEMKMYCNGVDAPEYAHEGDAGLDLRISGNGVLIPGQTKVFGTGLYVELPEGTVGLVYARSGLATKYGIAPANKVGVIDSGYRGEIKIALHNHSPYPVQITKGDKVAQLIVTPFIQPKIVCVDELSDLSDTERGDGGFGSTGK